MKILGLVLSILILASLAWGQLFYENNVSRMDAIKTASKLEIGMWEENAANLLATNGIKFSMGTGAIGGWDRCYGLSDGTSLHFSYTARTLATNGFWGGNVFCKEHLSKAMASILFS